MSHLNEIIKSIVNNIINNVINKNENVDMSKLPIDVIYIIMAYEPKIMLDVIINISNNITFIIKDWKYGCFNDELKIKNNKKWNILLKPRISNYLEKISEKREKNYNTYEFPYKDIKKKILNLPTKMAEKRKNKYDKYIRKGFKELARTIINNNKMEKDMTIRAIKDINKKNEKNRKKLMADERLMEIYRQMLESALDKKKIFPNTRRQVIACLKINYKNEEFKKQIIDIWNMNYKYNNNSPSNVENTSDATNEVNTSDAVNTVNTSDAVNTVNTSNIANLMTELKNVKIRELMCGFHYIYLGTEKKIGIFPSDILYLDYEKLLNDNVLEIKILPS